MKYILSALILALTSGCDILGDSNDPNMSLEIDRITYRPGNEVILYLFNRSGIDRTVHPTLCGAQLQRYSSYSWQSAQPSGGTCAAVGFLLRNGKMLSASRVLSDTLSPGEYRFMYEIWDWHEEERYRVNKRTALYSSTLRIEGPSE